MSEEAKNIIKNRIIGYGEKPADQFEANPLNYRTHPQRQREAMQASLSELGWIGVVVENVRTGLLIDGHERVWQALGSNDDVPFIQVDLSEEEERLALAIFDPLGAMAGTDAEILHDLLEQTSAEGEALQDLLQSLAYSAIPDDGLPNLDDLEDEYGEPNEEDFWPEIRITVAPDTFEAYESLMRLSTAGSDADKFASLIAAVDATAL